MYLKIMPILLFKGTYITYTTMTYYNNLLLKGIGLIRVSSRVNLSSLYAISVC